MVLIVDRFPKVFSGVGKLSGSGGENSSTETYPLKEKFTRKINELIDLNIIGKASGSTTWVNPTVFAPKPDKRLWWYLCGHVVC